MFNDGASWLVINSFHSTSLFSVDHYNNQTNVAFSCDKISLNFMRTLEKMEFNKALYTCLHIYRIVEFPVRWFCLKWSEVLPGSVVSLFPFFVVFQIDVLRRQTQRAQPNLSKFLPYQNVCDNFTSDLTEKRVTAWLRHALNLSIDWRMLGRWDTSMKSDRRDRRH